MKNLKLKISKSSFSPIYLILILILFSCEKIDKPKPENKNARAEMLRHIIPTNEAFTMYDNYSKSRITLLKDTLQKMYRDDFYDTRTVWFSIETLKEYIKYVEEESRINKIKPEGFKICFGVYANNDSLGKKANHQNIFFVPTTLNDDRQSAYTIQENGSVLFFQKARKHLNNNTPIQEKAAFFSFTTAFAKKGLVLNKGESSPPPDSNDADFN